MKEICLDEGTIQAFLDGELANAQTDAATRHIALCRDCALLLSAAEEESAFAFSALDGELNTLVPTQRLWSKINDSIIEEKRKHSFWFNFTSFVSSPSLKISNPSVAAFASLFIVAGLFAALLISRPVPNQGLVIVDEDNFDSVEIAKADTPAFSNNGTKKDSDINDEDSDEEPTVVPTVTNAASRPARNEDFSAVKADFVTPNQKPKTKNQKPITYFVVPQYLPGEETYIRTIANLSETVNSQKDTVMKPSARFAYEKDLAMINDAIGKMKEEVKRNPKNEAAKDILFASYQNKVNLLNSVTERSELIASIR
ncbi:hypothetical protein BH20ACI4_BH20ACI4_04200 [soil metagenome]